MAVGYFAQNIFRTFTKEKQDELTVWTYELLLDLYNNETKYTDDLYAETGLSPDVKAYVRYNANKALQNLGLPTMFPEEQVNPIVMNGILNEGSTYDFFSQKGATYAVGTVKEITKETFDFNGVHDE